MSRNKVVLVVAFFAAALSQPAFGQTCGGSITGNVCVSAGWATTFFNFSSPNGGAIYVVSSASNQPAIYSYSGGHNGLTGDATSTYVSGVYGQNTATGGYGVAGRANTTNGVGVYGESVGTPDEYKAGVRGMSSANGVWGEGAGAGTAGVYGNCIGDECVGVLGGCEGDGCRGALFLADVAVLSDLNVQGAFSANFKFFQIDHPEDPENKVLRHSVVESSDYKNFYDGIGCRSHFHAASFSREVASWGTAGIGEGRSLRAGALAT
ncbi:MAG: hypothetical protein JNK82_16945 [Myxococcaceae bacterium]|nr:hypothetical protein [Myxococcaceae bacterium]